MGVAGRKRAAEAGDARRELVAKHLYSNCATARSRDSQGEGASSAASAASAVVDTVIRS
jgi:hypothetical protein